MTRPASMTTMRSEAAIAAWRSERRTTRGGQPQYSALAIATALTLRAVFRLALRQTEDLIGSILRLVGLDLPIPNHTTLSRRAETLQVPRVPSGPEPVHLLVDSTGLQLCGPGEWLRPASCGHCSTQPQELAEDIGLQLASARRGRHQSMEAGDRRCTPLTHGRMSGDRGGNRRRRPQSNTRSISAPRDPATRKHLPRPQRRSVPQGGDFTHLRFRSLSRRPTHFFCRPLSNRQLSTAILQLAKPGCELDERAEIMSWQTGRSLLLALPVAVALSLPAPAAEAPRDRTDTKGVVEIETGTSASISVRMAEEMAGIVNDGATRRVVPVVGKGSLQNLTDLVMLRGVDMAILQQDVLDFARQRRLVPGVEEAVTYVARLYNEEFHLLARAEIASVADLANRRVNVDLHGSGTAFTAERLFEQLRLPVVVTNDSQPTALEKLKRGEIAAMAFVVAQPAPLFAGLRRSDGLHFLEIQLDPKATTYPPTRLSADAYPELIAPDVPVATPAVGTVLAVANLARDSERYRNVETFVEVFFSQFGTLLELGHHPKWQEVNLGSDLPGWRRFPAADLWLKRNAANVEAAPSAIPLKALFARFIEERQRALGGPPMTQKQKDDLFEQFYRWQSGQGVR